MKGGRKMKSRIVKNKTNKTRKRCVGKTRRLKKGISIGGAGDEPISLLPKPYKITGMENGSSTPQQSAIMAQRNADLQQNEMNLLIGGEPSEEQLNDQLRSRSRNPDYNKSSDAENNLPVVQFSGKNSAVTNQQSVELTNILATNRAASVGDAEVSVHE